MRLLVTGGAGYIGSVVASALIEAGHDVTVLDDLSTGHADAVPAKATAATMAITRTHWAARPPARMAVTATTPANGHSSGSVG